MLERTRLEVQDIANKAARLVFARQNVRILAAEHVRQMVKREVGGRFKQLDDDTRAAIAASADQGARTAIADLDLPAAGEPLDVGRLIFAVAHPAMLRRIWFAVCDSLDADLAQLISDSNYGGGPRDSRIEDLPAGITDPYVFPYLEPGDIQWASLDSAMDWCHRMFADLGLIH